MSNDSDHTSPHQTLYYSVQEAFVGNLVHAARVAGEMVGDEVNGLNKTLLAEISGLSKGTITKLTSSDPEDARPDLETLCKIGQALNISPAFLLMTSRDWSVLIQAFGTIESLRKHNETDEQGLVAELAQASNLQKLDEAAIAGVKFVAKLTGDDFSCEDRKRQQRGILAMTAMAQASVKRYGSQQRMFAIALGAILGNREINQS